MPYSTFHPLVLPLAVTLMLLAGCRQLAPSTVADNNEPLALLSDYKLFNEPLRQQIPRAGVLPYDLNTPLFSDYTAKFRFIALPKGGVMTCGTEGLIDFPIGTILVKTFAYPKDQRSYQKEYQLLETRIMKHEPEGWVGYPYIWNEDQTDAKLKVTGSVIPSTWIHFDARERRNDYIVPNQNQCKGCHENQKVMKPIGPKVHHLDRTIFQDSGSRNQLEEWESQGLLKNLPKIRKPTPVWDDSTQPIEERARAWLDVNCAHCHNPQGPANTSGLDLRLSQNDPAKWGIMKSPVAAGKGTGGRLFDIVPGKPDKSILVFRLESTEPGVMMPELPRRMVDEEGVRLIRQWISSMNPK